MSRHEGGTHEDLRELCALAAIGEASPEELMEVKAHVNACSSCRVEYDDYQDILNKKPTIAERWQKAAWRFRQTLHSNGYRERFISEAENRGFHFSEEVARPRPFWLGIEMQRLARPAFASLVIALLIVMAAVLAHRLRESNLRNSALATQISETNGENGTLRQELADRSGPRQSSVTEHAPAGIAEPSTIKEAAPSARSDDADYRSLEAELTKARADNATLLARSSALEEQLQAASFQVHALRAELETGKSTGGELAAKLKEAERNLGEMTGEIKDLRNGRSKDAYTITAQDARVKELSERLRDQAETLDRERRLLTADRNIRDLMTARNLHIIDVYDVDGKGKDIGGKGKTRKTFGRAFYTEDKSLIFYAFDLEDRRITKANYSLQAWGYQHSAKRTVQSLGILYVDDQKQNRWALKFDDPEVLAWIDTVFVTIEPPGGSKKPSGERLLEAYLKGPPNHP